MNNDDNITSNAIEAANYTRESTVSEKSLGVSWGHVVLGVVLYAIVAVTVVGNALVLIAVVRDRRLQTVFNIFITNLAITDISVGLVAMNFYAMFNILETWPFGEFLCGVWIFFDFGMTFASIFTVLAISVDRFWSVQWSNHYRIHNNRRKAFITIGGIWAAVVLLWVPPFTMDRLEHSRPGECFWNPAKNKEFVILVASVGYHGTTAIMMCCYVKVFLFIRHRNKIRPLKLDNLRPQASTFIVTENSSRLTLLNEHLNDVTSAFDKRAVPNKFNPPTQTGVKDLGGQWEQENPCLNSTPHKNKVPQSAMLPSPSSSKSSSQNTESGNVWSSILPRTSGAFLHPEDAKYISHRLGLSKRTQYKTSGSNPSTYNSLAPDSVSSSSMDDGIEYIDLENFVGNERRNQSSEARASTHSNQKQGEGNNSTPSERSRKDSNSSRRMYPQPDPSLLVDKDAKSFNKVQGMWVTGSEDRDTRHTQQVTPVLRKVNSDYMSGSDARSEDPSAQSASTLKRERKVFFTLTCVVVGYLICWLPFHVCFDIVAIDFALVPERVYAATYWLAYLNSTINPILYNLSSPDFHRAFQKLVRRK